MSLTDAVQDEDSETEEQSDDIETAEENAEEEILNMKVQIGDNVFAWKRSQPLAPAVKNS